MAFDYDFTQPEVRKAFDETMREQFGFKETVFPEGYDYSDPEVAKVFNESIYQSLQTETPEVTQEAPKKDEQGLIEIGGKGLVRGILGVAQSANTGLQWLGGRMGSETLTEMGQTGQQYWQEAAEPYAPPAEIAGSVWEDKKLLGNAKWWVSNVAEMVPSMAAALAPGLGAASAAQKVAALARFAPVIGSVVGGAAGGSLEAAQTYQEVLKQGGTEKEAARSAELMGVISAGLNAMSLGPILSKAGITLKSKVLKTLGAAAWEGLFEGLEEPGEVVAKYMGKYLAGEELPGGKEFTTQLLQSFKDAVSVAPIAALTGGGAAMITTSAETKKANSNPIVQQYKAGEITLDQATAEIEATEAPAEDKAYILDTLNNTEPVKTKTIEPPKPVDIVEVEKAPEEIEVAKGITLADEIAEYKTMLEKGEETPEGIKKYIDSIKVSEPNHANLLEKAIFPEGIKEPELIGNSEGKPFPTKTDALFNAERRKITETHEAVKNDKGWWLKEKPPVIEPVKTEEPVVEEPEKALADYQKEAAGIEIRKGYTLADEAKDIQTKIASKEMTAKEAEEKIKTLRKSEPKQAEALEKIVFPDGIKKPDMLGTSENKPYQNKKEADFYLERKGLTDTHVSVKDKRGWWHTEKEATVTPAETKESVVKKEAATAPIEKPPIEAATAPIAKEEEAPIAKAVKKSVNNLDRFTSILEKKYGKGIKDQIENYKQNIKDGAPTKAPLTKPEMVKYDKLTAATTAKAPSEAKQVKNIKPTTVAVLNKSSAQLRTEAKASTKMPDVEQYSTVAQVEKELRRQSMGKGVSNLLKSGRLKIVQTEQELAKLINAEEDLVLKPKGARIAGFYDADSKNKTSYLVADNIKPEEVWGLLRHEVGTHAGLKGLLGKSHNRVVKETSRLIKAGDPAILKARRKAEAAKLKNSTELDLAEETVAYFVQDEGNKTHSLYRRIVASVKRYMAKIGIVRPLTSDDISAFVNSALQKEMKSAADIADKITEKPELKADIEIAGKKTPVEIQESEPIKFSIKTDTTESGKYFGEDKKTLKSKVMALVANEPTTKSKVGKVANLAADRLTTQLVDRMNPIKVLGEKAYQQHRMTGNVNSVMAAVLKYGKLTLTESGGVKAEKAEGGGFIDWYIGLKDEGPKLLKWVAAKRAEKLAEPTPEFPKGRENYLTEDKRKQIFKDTYPSDSKKAKAMNDKLQTFIKSVLDFSTDCGIIDAESRAEWEQDFYLPFYRLIQEQKGLFDSEVDLTAPSKIKRHVSSGIKQLKGGEAKLGDPLENLITNWSHLVNESMRNIARAEAFESGKALGIIRRVPKSFISMKDKQTLSFKKDGKTVFFQVTDPELFNSLSEFNKENLNTVWSKMFGGAKNMLTKAVTKSPGFMVANLTRDTIGIGVMQKNFTPFIDTFRGAMQIIKESPDFIAVSGSGGLFNQGYDATGRTPGKMAASLAKNTQKGKRITFKSAYDLWTYIGDITEMASRVQLYSNLAKISEAKGIDGHLGAAFAAKDVLDFSLKGASKVVNALVTVTPFMNARAQGLYKLGRAFNEDRMSFIKKGSLLTAVSLALWAFWKDDERYTSLTDTEKFMYHHIWIGDYHLRIPKAFEIGMAFSSFPEAAANIINGTEEGKHMMNFIGHTLQETLRIDVLHPQLLKPYMEVQTNKNTYTGNAIEGWGQLGKSTGKRYNPWTPEVLKKLGDLTNMSPLKAQHVISGYFAGIGDVAVMAADWVYTGLVDLPDRPTMSIGDYPVIGRFVKSDRQKTTKYAQRNWDTLEELTQLNNDLNAMRVTGDYEKTADFMNNNRDKLRAYRIAKEYKKQLDVVRKQRVKLWTNTFMDSDEKAERDIELETRQNEIHKRMYDRIFDVTKK